MSKSGEIMLQKKILILIKHIKYGSDPVFPKDPNLVKIGPFSTQVLDLY